MASSWVLNKGVVARDTLEETLEAITWVPTGLPHAVCLLTTRAASSVRLESLLQMP